MKKCLVMFEVLLFSILFSSCYSWYDSRIKMDKETPKTNLGELFYEEKEITELNTPAQIIVSKGKYSGTIKLHWDEVPYATSYRLERAVVEPDSDTGIYRTPDESDFEVLSKYVYSCNYSDIILASPSDSDKQYSNRYYYRVSAENIKQGLESSEFTPVSENSYGWLLKPPAKIDAAKGENTEYIEITWSAVEQANKYLIYRGEKSNGLGMEFLQSVTGNTLSYKNELSDNEKGVEFYYKVCAVLADGSQSAFTGLALGYSAKIGAPPAPLDIVMNNGAAVSKKSLSISWSGYTQEDYKITYSIYRTSSIDSIYTLVRNNVTGTSFTDESLLKPGIKYYYYIQTVAVNEDDATDILKSSFSKTGPGTPDEVSGWLLSPPNNCEVLDSSIAGKSILRWTPSVGSEVVDYNYNIYYCQELDGQYELLLQDIQPGSGVNLDSDGYYSLTVDKKPFYRITAINETANLESDQGQTVAPCPSAPTNVIASKTSALDGLNKYEPNTNGVYPVKITWKAPNGENPYGYYIYRSTKPDSAFRKISDTPVTGTSLEFIDSNETARPGTFYYYKVVSLNILMQGKNANGQSADSRGYGALTRDQWFREYNKTVKKSLGKLTLMHKSGDMEKLGQESVNGDISGSLSYNAKVEGTSGRVLMHYSNYADFYAGGDSSSGIYFLLNGDTNTTASMSKNGSMDGTNTADQSGMYPGYAIYNNVAIKGGAAGGGYYVVCTKDKSGNVVLNEGNVDWTVGEE